MHLFQIWNNFCRQKIYTNRRLQKCFFSAVKTNSVNAVLSWKQNNGAEDAWKLLQQTEQRVSVFEQLLKQ